MRFTRPFILATSACIAVLFASATIAEAKARKHAGSTRTLTVKKRSFLDSGRVVPVGSESHYVSDQVRFGRTTDYYSQRSRYGNETLPGRFDLPATGGLFNF